MGAPLNDTGGTDKGAVRFFFLNGTSLPVNNIGANITLSGQSTGDKLGMSLANTGTSMMTGGDNVAAGAPGNGGKLHVYTYSSTGPLSSPPRVTGADVGCAASFGTYVAGPGNVDGSVRDDVLVGGPQCGTSSEGKAWLVTSTGSYGVAVSAWSFESNEANAELGVVAGVGDIDGDARPDFAVGAPKMNAGGTDRGKVWFFRGAAGIPSTTAFGSLYSPTSNALFGAAIAGGRDVNNDGLADWIIGAPAFSNDVNTPNEGRIYVYHGHRGSFSDHRYHVSEGNGADLRRGAAVAMGNVNGTDDGAVYGDVAFGSPGSDNGLVREGFVFVRKGIW